MTLTLHDVFAAPAQFSGDPFTQEAMREIYKGLRQAPTLRADGRDTENTPKDKLEAMLAIPVQTDASPTPTDMIAQFFDVDQSILEDANLISDPIGMQLRAFGEALGAWMLDDLAERPNMVLVQRSFPTIAHLGVIEGVRRTYFEWLVSRQKGK